DPDSLDLVGATVSIAGGTFGGDGDVLAADTSGTAITASYDSASETLTLSGADTVAHYQAVLDSLTFASGADPSAGGPAPARVVPWVVEDGSASNPLSSPQSTTIDLHLGPAILLPAAAAFTENGASATLAPAVTLNDSTATTTLVSATVQITGGVFSGDGDGLAADATVLGGARIPPSDGPASD